MGGGSILLRNRSFLLLMLGEVIAGSGLWVFIIGNLQFMQHLVPSDFHKALILMTGLIASVLLSPKAGVVIDRYDKKKILIVSSIVRCLSPLMMLPAIASESIVWMVVALVIQQSSNAFYLPTVQASLPAIFTPDKLLRANSVYLNIVTLSRIGGTALGGVMVASLSLGSVYLVSLAANLLLAIFTFFLIIPKETQNPARMKQMIRFSEVFSLIRQDPAVIVGLVNTLMITLFLGGFNLLVLKYSEIHHSSQLMGFIYAFEGVSILLAGLISKQVIGNRNLVTLSSLLLFAFALAQVGLSFAENRAFILGSFALFGAGIAFFFPAVTTVFQKRLALDAQGRFFSFKGMLERVLLQISLLTTGACLDLIGISNYMLAVALVTLVMGIASCLYGKRHGLDVRQHDSTDQAA